MRYDFTNKKGCTVLVAVFFISITLLVYASNFYGGFVFDDFDRVEGNLYINPVVWDATAFKSLFNYLLTANRPVAMVSFALNYLLFDGSLLSFHLFNLGIHGLTGFGVFLLIRKTLGLESNFKLDREKTFIVAFFSSLIWLVHPLNSQAVNFIVQRMTLLAVLFFVWSLVFYLSARIKVQQSCFSRKTFALFFLSLVCFLLGMGSKSSVIVLPVILFLYELLFFQKLSFKKCIQLCTIFLGVLFVALFCFSLFRGNVLEMLNRNYNNYNGDLPRTVHWFTECRVLVYYLRQFFIPDISLLHLEYDFPISQSLFSPMTTLYSLLFLLSLFWGAIWNFFRGNRLVTLVVLWFLGSLALESFVIKLDLVYEHRMYLASILLPLPLVLYLVRFVRSRVVCTTLGAAVFILGALTYQRSRDWSIPGKIYRQNVRLAPAHRRALYNCFWHEVENWTGDEFFLSDELLDYLITLEGDRRFPGGVVPYYKTASAVWAMRGNLKKSKDYFNLAEAKLEAGGQEKLHRDYGKLMYDLGYCEKALGHFEKLLAASNEDVKYQVWIVRCYLKEKRYDLAVSRAIQFLENGQNPFLLQLLAVAYMESGDMDQAVMVMRKACELVQNNGRFKQLLKWMESRRETHE
jgi:tetratricopeptide (TPR) repeat protein